MTKAVFTLLYTASYLPGALVLGSSLKKLIDQNGQDIDIGILIDKSKFSNHQLSLLNQFYNVLIDVNPLKSTITDKLIHDLGRPELDKTFTKINLWSLIDYETVLYLDSDTLPVLPTSSNQGSVIDLLSLDFPKFKILAAPDSGFPDIFNSGVFVLKPNLNDYTILDNLVRESITNPNVSFDGADQGLLNQYFNTQPDWVRALLSQDNTNVNDAFNTTNWIKIPFLYNVTPSSQYEYLPAFKHFTTITPNFPPTGPSEYPINLHGGENDEENDQILQSTLKTLSRYQSSAFTYIQSSGPSQVKLIHFIGPFKPWRSRSTATGIHRDWWKVWIDTFGQKSIDEIVNLDTLPYIFSNDDDVEIEQQAVQQSTDQQNFEQEYQEHHHEEPAPFTPATLLDPSNYQQYEDSIVPSADALWDPSKEPPPTSEPISNPVNLEQGLRSFTNQWDEPQQWNPPPPEHHYEPEPAYEEPVPAYVPPPPAPEPEHVHQPPAATFPFTHYVEPERVFDSSSDYFPSHRLQPVEKIDIYQEEAINSQSSVLGDKVTDFNDINERLAHIGIIEDKAGFDDIYDENETTRDEPDDGNDTARPHIHVYDRSDVPKLFPWEFKQNDQGTERVFD
ncbi:transferase activity protein [Scheffersomyces coipomensis]|uniref:transferase activity protein n=1 Tax=Scheffersomyces coipomensis TaxID=1788519 RepID=UPI00315CAD5F